MSVLERIERALQEVGAEYQVLRHPEARTAQSIADVRGTPLSMGGKSLVMKLDRGIGFAVLAVPGDRQLSNPNLRTHLGVRRYRFATREELAEVTGLVPGCVPPFGRPVFDLPLYVDAQLAAQPEIAFSAGDHQISIRMRTADWLAAARPEQIAPLSRAP